ncbi:DNA polymerase III subunit gamma/tau [Candidatus Persebacteraceae bacterium Df01]|jgi:DNA polymerase-3 subunit gamma/tau|uniref:DNA polymerase III subunit gamma/tau n=1 Tax=Candidatus Doriopsillibacter californiensis TaxID=2970740 RepID=A0ABT7QMY0_9GAMM|nr:DNA polymerase III subunit gamma/tau [Candidatus Persebacteraceae bacterium Df01]
MSQPFLSLARKWRPQRFSDLVGHEHTVRVLQNAMRQNRLHHAFLFTGTRGVGKTTLARIVAMMVNCDNSADSEPCLQCDVCKQIAGGRLLDVIELDAASHTQVDKIRELLEGASYPPSQGRCKVFIIDEVHMLSKSAFAAMLKTLEEPPSYVKFILATTDPQKLPATILSRCLRFSLRPLSKEQIAAHLAVIMKAEKQQYNDDALMEIARLACGSMRDALSLLEQAIVHSDGKLEAAEVRRISGQPDIGILGDILRAVATVDASSIANIGKALAMNGASFDATLTRLAALIYQTALSRVAPNAVGDDDEETTLIKEIAKRFDDELLQTLYEIAVRGRRQLPLAPDEQTGFEMTLLRMMLFSPAQNSAASAATIPTALPTTHEAVTPAASNSRYSASSPNKTALTKPPTASKKTPKNWEETLQQLHIPALTLAEVCTMQTLTANGVKLSLDISQSNIRRFLPELETQLRDIFHDRFTVTLADGTDNTATTALHERRTTAAKEKTFVSNVLATVPSAQLIPDSIRLFEQQEATHDR